MKTLAVIALCLLPWTVKAQPDTLKAWDWTDLDPSSCLTRAEVQAMIDSAVAQIGRWEPRLHVLDRCPERRDGCLVNHLPSEWIYDTVWVFVRREAKP